MVSPERTDCDSLSVKSPGIAVAFLLAAMLILRNGGQFTDSQIKKYLKLSAIYFAVAYVGIFVAGR